LSATYYLHGFVGFLLISTSRSGKKLQDMVSNYESNGKIIAKKVELFALKTVSLLQSKES